MPRLRPGLTGLLALTCAGCTFLNQGDPRPVVALELPDGVPAPTGGAGRRLAVLVPFADQRPLQVFCGDQKKTYALTPGKILCAVPPAAALAELLAAELRAAGFDVSLADGVVMADRVKLEGQLLQFFVEPVRGPSDTETDIHVRLRVTSADGLEAEREFYEKGRGSDFQRSVNSALRKILPAMATAVIGLLDAYPQVAAPFGDPAHLP